MYCNEVYDRRRVLSPPLPRILNDEGTRKKITITIRQLVVTRRDVDGVYYTTYDPITIVIIVGRLGRLGRLLIFTAVLCGPDG